MLPKVIVPLRVWVLATLILALLAVVGIILVVVLDDPCGLLPTIETLGLSAVP